jgi:sugar-specific transcriptional regulator TrmB
METNLVQKLASIGLTEAEARVYIALLEIGTTSIGAIVDMAEVSASKVYDILDRLMHKGLVGMIVQENTRLYSANPPEALLEYLEAEKKAIDEKKEGIRGVLPELALKSNTAEKKAVAEFSRGKRGFEACYMEMIRDAKEGESYYYTGGTRVSYKLQSLWYPYSKIMAEKKIINRAVYEYDVWHKKDPKVHQREKRKNFYPTVLNKDHVDLPNVLVLADKVIISWLDENEEVNTLIFRDRILAQNFVKLMNVIMQSSTVPEGYEKAPEK